MGAGSNIGAFKIGTGNTGLFIYILIAVIAIALIILLVRKIRSGYKTYKIKKDETERFNRICRKRRLTHEEIEFIVTVNKKYHIRRPLLMVRSMRIFDKYMAREVALLRNEETKKKERFKVFVFGIRKKLGFANFDNLEELNSTRPIKKGTRAKVTIMIANMEKKFSGRITEVDEEGLIVSVPDHFMNDEPIRVNQNASITITHREDAVYKFKTMIFKVIPGTPGHIALEHSRSFDRSQRRKYPRMDIEIPFKFFLLDHLQEKEFRERRNVTLQPDQHFSDGVIQNFSGGGCYFHSPVEYEIGNMFWLSFYLEDMEQEFRDIVAQAERTVDLNNDEYRTILRFSKIRDTLRDKITRYIYIKKTEQKQTQKVKAV